MHPDYQRADSLTFNVINAAIEVHRILGPGLIESIYEWAICEELTLRGYAYSTRKSVVIRYKNASKVEPLVYDILVEDCLLLEIKAVEQMHPIFKSKLLSYMKLLDVPVDLLLNFHEIRLVDGISRLYLPNANKCP